MPRTPQAFVLAPGVIISSHVEQNLGRKQVDARLAKIPRQQNAESQHANKERRVKVDGCLFE